MAERKPANNAPPLVSDYAGDPEMVELIAEFQTSLPERIAGLERSFRDGAIEDLRRHAHQLKGAGGGYGFRPISAAAARLEDEVRGLGQATAERSIESVEEQVSELVAMCRRAMVRPDPSRSGA